MVQCIRVLTPFRVCLRTSTLLSRNAVMGPFCQRFMPLVIQRLLRRIIISFGSFYSPPTQRPNYKPFAEDKVDSNLFHRILFTPTKRRSSHALVNNTLLPNFTKEDPKNESAKVKALMRKWKSLFVAKDGQTSQLFIHSFLFIRTIS